MSAGYHGAPQVFYFTPHRKWYLIYQLEDSSRNIPFGPCYSTTNDINDPTSWSLIVNVPPGNSLNSMPMLFTTGR